MNILGKIFLVACLAFNFASANDWLDIEESELENGLKVIVWNKRTNGVIYCSVAYYVGSGDDPRNVVGISHVLEHLMFKGTKRLSGEELKKITFIGDRDSNAFTSFDITCYVHCASKEFIDVDLALEADRMVNLKLDKEALEKELEVIIEERKMRTESEPIQNYMEEAAWKAMYFFSNYSYPIIGYLDQIKACNEQEVIKHYKKFYKPNNAFILFVGDITMKEALEKVKKYFGNIKRGEDHSRERVIDPEDTGLFHTLEHEADNISVHNLNLIYKVDRKYFDNLRKLIALEIAVEILAAGPSSLLFQNIVDKKKLSYNLASLVDIRAFDKGRVNIATVFRENLNDKDVENELNAIIYNYANKYLTKELFEKEKEKFCDQIEHMEDNPQNMGLFALEFLINGYKVSEFRKIKSIIKDIKFEEVRDVAREVFTKKNRFMRIYSHPKKA